ncbi:HNH endonuclease [Nocardia brasiliensis]
MGSYGPNPKNLHSHNKTPPPRGGPPPPPNLQILCRSCNRAKGARI